MTTGGKQGSEELAPTCARCGAVLRLGRGECYRVTAVAVADPSAPEFTAEDLARDVRPEIEALLARLAGASEEDLLAQVYRRFHFWLCPPCYRAWSRRPAG